MCLFIVFIATFEFSIYLYIYLVFTLNKSHFLILQRYVNTTNFSLAHTYDNLMFIGQHCLRNNQKLTNSFLVKFASLILALHAFCISYFTFSLSFLIPKTHIISVLKSQTETLRKSRKSGLCQPHQ